MNWSNPTDKVAKYFTVKEALFLPTWNRLANEEDGLNDKVKVSLIKTFAILDKVRELFNKPVIVHVAYRPAPYNALVKGAKRSAHIFGLAVDFHVAGISCDEARRILASKLEEFKIRMEDLPGSSWVHIDTRVVYRGCPRLFKP